MRPKTQYATRDGACIAYQVVGEGPVDLVFIPGFASHLELQWSDPLFARFLRRISESARLVIYDKRGAGLSDSLSGPQFLEDRVADLRAVMDAAGCDQVVLLGFSDGAPAAILGAAEMPDRVSALISVFGFARGGEEAGDSFGLGPDAYEHGRQVVEAWGTGASMELFAPSLRRNRMLRELWAIFERASVRKDMLDHLFEMTRKIDVTDVIGAVSVPTLVLQRRNDLVIPFENGRLIAQIRNARFVELEGADHVPFAGDANAVLLAIEAFLAEITEHPVPRTGRAFSTLLFTDIVGSTARLSEVGDTVWRETIETHDEIMRSEIEREGGTFVKSTGDGVLATLPGPLAAYRVARRAILQTERLNLQIRAAVHAGECEEISGQVGGTAVHVAARLLERSGPGQIFATRPAQALLGGTGVSAAPRGVAEFKGLPGDWEVFELSGEPVKLSATPSVGTDLGFSDRLSVGMAKHAPGLARTLGRLAARA